MMRAATLLLAGCGFLLGQTARAASLLVLQSGPHSATIQDGPGVVPAPMAGIAETQWQVLPGTNRYQSTPPADRRINLFEQVNGALKRIAAIRLRYYWTAASGWTPHYRMSEQMYFVRTPAGWRPLALSRGAPDMMNYTGTGGANAQGYFASLQFSATSGPITIDAWSVERLTSSPGAPYP